MVNYKDGKIYKIVCNTSGLTYYGSTVQPLYKRLYTHKNQLNCSSKVIIEGGNYDISLVELFECNSKEELHSRERYFIENNKCVNKIIPTRTQKEWIEQNKDKIKEYREKNIDKIHIREKKYRDENPNIKKEYRKENKDKLKEQSKLYYEKNKEYRKKYQKEYHKNNWNKQKQDKRNEYQKKYREKKRLLNIDV